MIIGITGPIASGKDLIISFFQKMNCIIIDADKIGKFIVESNFNKIAKIYNVTNFKELGELIFSDFRIFENYNKLIHPILSKKIREILINFIKNKENFKKEILILNCALLFLFKLEAFCDLIIFADCDSEIRKNRLINRNKISLFEATNRIEFQEKIENFQRIRENININKKVIYIKNEDKVEILNKKIESIIEEFLN